MQNYIEQIMHAERKKEVLSVLYRATSVLGLNFLSDPDHLDEIAQQVSACGLHSDDVGVVQRCAKGEMIFYVAITKLKQLEH